MPSPEPPAPPGVPGGPAPGQDTEGDPETETDTDSDTDTDASEESGDEEEFQTPGGKADPDAPTTGGDEGNGYRFNPEVRATVQAILRAKALSQAENPPGVGPGDPPPDMWTPFQSRGSDARVDTFVQGQSNASYREPNQSHAAAETSEDSPGGGHPSSDGAGPDIGLKSRLFRMSAFDQLRAFGRVIMLAPADPGPVDLRTARIVDSDAATGLVGGALSAHELSEQRIAPRARFARATRK